MLCKPEHIIQKQEIMVIKCTTGSEDCHAYESCALRTEFVLQNWGLDLSFPKDAQVLCPPPRPCANYQQPRLDLCFFSTQFTDIVWDWDRDTNSQGGLQNELESLQILWIDQKHSKCFKSHKNACRFHLMIYFCKAKKQHKIQKNDTHLSIIYEHKKTE